MFLYITSQRAAEPGSVIVAELPLRPYVGSLTVSVVFLEEPVPHSHCHCPFPFSDMSKTQSYDINEDSRPWLGKGKGILVRDSLVITLFDSSNVELTKYVCTSSSLTDISLATINWHIHSPPLYSTAQYPSQNFSPQLLGQ